MEAIEQYRSSGFIDLIVEQLDVLPEAEQHQRLQLIQQDFGFDIDLLSSEQSMLPANQVARLETHQIVFDKAKLQIYRRLANGGLLVISNIDRPAQHLHSRYDLGISGSIKVLQKILISMDGTEWSAKIDRLNSEVSVDIQLYEVDQLQLGSDELERLLRGDLIKVQTAESEALELPADVLYQRIGTSQSVLKVGPISPYIIDLTHRATTKFYSVLGLLIALPIFLWFLPTWISALNLNRAIRKFGRSEFQARVRLIFASNLNPLARVFNQMAKELESSITRNKVLTHAIAHELRTPLTSLEFALEMFEANHSQRHQERQLCRLKTCVQELRAMGQELSDFACFDIQKMKLITRDTDINGFLAPLAEKWQNSSSGIALSSTFAPSELITRFDSYYLGRAVDNLLRNSFKYADRRIHITVEQTPNGCHICVENDGRPIRVADTTRVFEPFVRLDSSRNRDSGGIGLGLAIVAQIAEAHGGQVWVENGDLGGAKFVLRLPNIKE